jgi:hypothetical protein
MGCGKAGSAAANKTPTEHSEIEQTPHYQSALDS